jgi:hypothetical protein
VKKALKQIPEKMEGFTIRLTPKERAALDAAGASEDRTAGYISRRLINEWLKEKRFLK